MMIPAYFKSFVSSLVHAISCYLLVSAALSLSLGCSSKTDRNPSAVVTSQERPANASFARVPGFNKLDRHDSFLDPIFQKLDPANDQWDSEVFANQVGDSLKKIAKLIEEPATISNGNTKEFFSATFETSGLRPENLEHVYDGDAIIVSRGTITGPRRIADGKAVLDELLNPFQNIRDVHVKFKVVSVKLDGSPPQTTVDVQVSGFASIGKIQQNAVWTVAWDESRPSPKIASIDASEFEEVVYKSSGGEMFVDQTESVLGSDESFRQQLTRGVDYWRGRLEANYGVDPNGNQGIALGDVNGDGLDDLFVCQQGGLPNRLYLRREDGTLHDIAKEAGVDWMEVCRSALFVDLDNDGDQDLAMAQGWYLMIMSNDGTGKFTVVQEKRSPANLYSITAADYDNDGDLDLFFCGRNPAREQGTPEGILGMPIPYHDANNGGPNILLRNDGGFRFVDATKSTGLDTNNRRYSYAASWEDFDNDGDMDLYVANDFGRNNLYRNDLKNGRRTFHDMAKEMQVEDISAGMSVTWGDYDRDGWMDVYVSNMFSSAGNRIAYQRQFRSESRDNVSHFQRHARGNTLFRNDRSSFNDVSLAAAVTMGRWAWGSKFVDLNNDGWEDLYVTNGFITTEDTGDL